MQVDNYLGNAHHVTIHVWQDRREAIVTTVDNLGDGFRPALSNGWLAYIKKAYPDPTAGHNPEIGQGTLVVAELAGAIPA